MEAREILTGIFDNLNKLQVDINNKLINLEKLINSKDEIIKTISKRLDNVEQLSNNNNKSLIDLKKNMKRDTEKKVDLGEHGVSDNMSFACDELGENYDDNIAEKNFKDDLFLENSMQKVYEDIIGNAQVDNENREKLYLLVIRQNQLQFKQIKRPLSEEEKGKYRASFKKITDQRGNIAYQIAQSCSDFNMEKYISSKLLTLKRNFRFNKANNGRNKEHFYTLRYNNKQIQFIIHSNIDRQRFMYNNFYIEFFEDKFSLYISKFRFNNGNKNNNSARNRKRNNNNYNNGRQPNNNQTYFILKKLVNQINNLTKNSKERFESNSRRAYNNRSNNFKTTNSQTNRPNRNNFNGNRFRQFNRKNNNQYFMKTSRY